MKTAAVFLSLLAIGLAANQLFRRADTDGDNHLTETEFDGIFHHWDLNNDKWIDQYEFVTGWDNDDWDDPENARVEFHLFDVDDDGYIKDVPDLRHLFHIFDSDNSTQVTSDEFDDAWETLFG